jgi:hypothetical protein
MSQAQTLTAIADIADVFSVPDSDTAYATVDVQGHRETWPVRSKGFMRWLRGKYYDLEHKPPGGQALADAIGVIEARAQFGGVRHPVAVRVAAHGANIYIDLLNDKWEAVEVTPAGWRIISGCPVRFRRTNGMLALPHPIAGGSLEDLRPFVNACDEDWPLIIGWLVATFRPIGPYPVLTLGGEHGAAKSTTSKVLRRCIDPHSADLRAEPTDLRDVMIAATNSWIVGFDNLSNLSPWLSDALCRLATGGAFGTRELYSNDEEKLFSARRPIIMNSIETIVTRPDLMDRSLVIDLPTVDPTQRLEEARFWLDFNAAHPRIFGALLDVVSVALLRQHDVKLSARPRMADFAVWVTAAEPALGWPDGQFLATYTRNQAVANALVLEASLLVPHLRDVVDVGEWQGTMKELLDQMNTRADDATRRAKGWPTNPRKLSGELRRLAPNLRAAGIALHLDEPRGSGGRRLVRISQNTGGKTPSRPSRLPQ